MSFDMVMWNQNFKKSKIMLHGYRQLYSTHKAEDCERRWKKILYFKLWIRKTITKRKNKRVIRIVKDELVKQIMIEFAALRSKTYSYLIDDSDKNRKPKDKTVCCKTKT